MDSILILFGGFAVVHGLLYLFARDAAWDVDALFNGLRGVASERTDSWETFAPFWGLYYVVIGGGVVALGLYTMTSL